MLVLLSLISCVVQIGKSHITWGWPTPRYSEPQNNNAPCGTQSDVWSSYNQLISNIFIFFFFFFLLLVFYCWNGVVNCIATHAITDLEPGSTVTVIIHEVVHHSGNPYRIALSREQSDVYDCILLSFVYHLFLFVFFFCDFAKENDTKNKKQKKTQKQITSHNIHIVISADIYM